MKRVQLSEIATAVDDIRRGETIEIVDGETAIATVVRKKTDEEILEDLERNGVIARERREPIPDWFFEERPPKFSESVLEQYFKDKRSRDY